MPEPDPIPGPDDVPGINEPWDANRPPPPPAGRNAGQPRPDDEVRTWTIIAHVSAVPAAFFALAFLGPLVVWLVRREVDPISGAHAKEALNFNLSVLLYGGIAFLSIFVFVGIVLLPAVALFWLVNVIRATVAVANGRTFRYPATIRLF